MLQQFCCELLLPREGGLLLEPEDPQQQLQQIRGREQVAQVRSAAAAVVVVAVAFAAAASGTLFQLRFRLLL